MANLLAQYPEVVAQPENTNTPVWRYMDFSAFVSMLRTKSLSFCRADKFDDPYEGVVPMRTHKKYKEAGNEKYLEYMGSIRCSTYLNCWYLGGDQSDAMWRHYAKKGGVAIKSTYAALQSSVPTKVDHGDILLGLVKYRDYDTFEQEMGNFFSVLLFKKKRVQVRARSKAISSAITYKAPTLAAKAGRAS